MKLQITNTCTMRKNAPLQKIVTKMEPLLPVVVSIDKTKQKVSFMAGAELISGTQLYRPPFYFAGLI